jgi:hypothetical protein
MTQKNFDPSKKTVYILYENDGNHNILYQKDYNLDGCGIPFVYLKEEIEKAGYNFKPTYDYSGLGFYTDVAYIISLTLLNQSILQSIAKHPKEKCFLFIQEPPTTHGYLYDRRLTQFFGKIFVMFDDLVDNNNYFKIYHPQRNEEMLQSAILFEEKKFCVMLQSNHYVQHPTSMYGERRNACSFFTAKKDFDLYGARWDGYASWKGPYHGKSKKNLIKNYKFTLSYENMHDQLGYITERIFDAFYAKTIPIYLGPKNINEYIPKECFINRIEFSSYENLYQHMKNINKTRYEEYINNAQNFINSPKSEHFSSTSFAKTIAKYIERT